MSRPKLRDLGSNESNGVERLLLHVRLCAANTIGFSRKEQIEAKLQTADIVIKHSHPKTTLRNFWEIKTNPDRYKVFGRAFKLLDFIEKMELDFWDTGPESRPFP